MKRFRALLLAGMLWLLPGTALADVLPVGRVPVGASGEESRPLLLEVHLNGQALGTLAMFRILPDGCARMEAAPLRSAGIYKGAESEVCLQSVAGLEFALDREAASIKIFSDSVAPEAAPRKDGRRTYARALNGLIGQYGLSAQHVDTPSGEFQSGFADLSLTLHTGWGRLQNDQVVVWDGSEATVQRLATTYERDFPDNMTRLTLGDSFTRAPRWGRLSAFAGVQFGTDFSMDPEETFRPYRTFQALLREQSEIDVRVNGSVRQQTSVPAGFSAFQVVPEAGLNQVEIAIRDGNGLTRIEDASFFASTDALARGVTDYAFSVGVPRQFDGVRANYEDTLMASGLARRGISDSVTVEAHGEVSDALWLAGGGAQIAAGQVGIVSVSAGISDTSQGARGHLISAGVERKTRRTSLQFQARVADTEYSDLASVAGVPFPDVSLRASAGVFTSAGAFRTSYSEQSDAAFPDRRFVSAGWEKSFGANRAILSASGFHDLEGEESGCTISLRINFGAYTVRAGLDRLSGLDSAAVELSRMRLSNERLQWSLRAISGSSADAIQGNLQADLGAADIFVHAGDFAGTQELSVGMRGGFTAVHNRFVLTRQATPASALVRVPGLAGVPVYQDNRPVAVTDSEGTAILPGVRPFEVNRLSLRPEDVPLDFAVGAFDLHFIPRRGVADVVFDVRRESALAFTAMREDGAPLAPGSRVTLAASGMACPVGMDGRVFCASAEDADTVVVVTPDGRFSETVRSVRTSGRLLLGRDRALTYAATS